MRYTLRYRHHDLELPQGEFLVGRASSCQLSLDDPLVSRHHARLVVTPESVLVEDLGSRNGVRVNQERIQGPRSLEVGDEIVIGSQSLVLCAEREVSAETLMQPPAQRNALGIVGLLADKALGLGRGEEAERLVGPALQQVLRDVEANRVISGETVERATDLAVRISSATGNQQWADWALRIYALLKKPCPLALVDELHSVMRRVKQPSPHALRAYLAVLRGLELGPTERFLVNRLEGLERLIATR